jgi:hypothetical protein
MDEFYIILVGLLVAILQILIENEREEPIPYHDSILTGQMRYDELMNSNNPHRFLDECRMSKYVFILFVEFMKDKGNLTDSKHICAGQKLMIYLTLLKGFSNREIHIMWQHSGSTISAILSEVMLCFESVKSFIFIPPPQETPETILSDPKYSPFFDNCDGCLDGSHCDAFTSDPLFRNRKKTMSQNVLAVVNFDLTFSYVLAGWEGSAHDGQVLQDALSKGFIRREGKFYLGDAGLFCMNIYIYIYIYILYF